jgi:membrane-bound serine protease (ClpP class)
LTGPVVEVLPIRGFLDPPLVSAIVRLIDNAERDGVELVVIQIDGPGAISADADRLLEAVQNSTVPVAVFVAAQQGLFAEAGGLYGLLWASAPVRAMSEFATVGPIDPLDLASGVGPDATQRELSPSIGAGAALDEAVAADELERAGAVDVLAGNVAALLAEMDGLEVVLADGTTTTLDLGAQEVNVRLHSLGILARLLHAAAAPGLHLPAAGLRDRNAGLRTVPARLRGRRLRRPGAAAVRGLRPGRPAGHLVGAGLLLLGFVLYSIDTAMAGLGPVTAAATASFGVGSWFLFGTDALRVPPVLAVATTADGAGVLRGRADRHPARPGRTGGRRPQRPGGSPRDGPVGPQPGRARLRRRGPVACPGGRRPAPARRRTRDGDRRGRSGAGGHAVRCRGRRVRNLDGPGIPSEPPASS